MVYRSFGYSDGLRLLCFCRFFHPLYERTICIFVLCPSARLTSSYDNRIHKKTKINFLQG